MESIQNTEVLDFPPGVLQNIRKVYGLDHVGAMDEAIDILDDWIKKQNHFTETNFDRDFLERTIILCKGSVERAKIRIDKMCTLRTLMPTFFDKNDVRNDLSEVCKLGEVAVLPKLLNGRQRVIMVKCADLPDTIDFKDVFRYVLNIAEYVARYEYCDGLVIILEYSHVNMLRLLQQINLYDLRQVLTILMDGYGMRLKAIHFITPSKVVETLIAILKQIFSTKIGNRIYAHRNKEALYDYMPRDMLPEEFGGKSGSLRQLNYKLVDALSSKDHVEYLKRVKKYKTNESYRAKDKFSDQYSGIDGTFRTLHID